MNKQFLESASHLAQNADAIQALASPALDPLFWAPQRIGSPSSWWTHVPFAFWVVSATKPRLLVELGTHYGVSYSAFCEAVARCRLATRCYAIDTWRGDPHAGSYDDSVLLDLRAVHDTRYSAFSELIQSTFDDAITYFEDESIDLLHIDGYHTYEAVKHDFENWLPKLSPRGVVLMHDTNVRENQFGVGRLWSELAKHYPSFEFQHGHGLGLLAVGRDIPSSIAELCALSDHEEIAAIRERFSTIGSRWFVQTQKQIDASSTAKGFAEAAASISQLEAAAHSAEERAADLTARLTESNDRAAAAQTTQLKIEHELALAEKRYSELIAEFTETKSRLASAAESARSLANEQFAAVARLSERLVSARTQLEALLKLSDRDLAASLRLIEQMDKNSTARPTRLGRRLQRLSGRVLSEKPKTTTADFAAATVVRHSSFFDPEWYLATYPDVAAAGMDPAEHYAMHGAEEGRDPGPNFSTNQYFSDNPDVRQAKLDPLTHFELHGRKDGRKLPAAMVVRNSLFFDPNWYLAKYPDVAADGFDPAEHYATHGAKEGRDPGPNFSTKQYLADNPDIVHAETDPLTHFEIYGRKEGRRLPIITEAQPIGQALASTVTNFPALVTERVRERLSTIIYVSGEPDTPGNRYRVLRQVEAAQKLGYRASWVRIDELAERLSEVQYADILILWRAAWNQDVESTISAVRANGGKVVFDVDDLMVEPDLARVEIIDGIRTNFLPLGVVQQHFTSVRRTMMAADVCSTTTEELAYFMRVSGKTAFVLPNGYDQSTHDISRSARRQWKNSRADDLIRIGYAAGSRTHQKDLECAIEGVGRVLRETPNCRLVLFRNRESNAPCIDIQEFPALHGLEHQIEWRPLRALEDLPHEMARFDINLAPLEVGNPFCEAKSELKFFESALVEVPTVASPTGPFRRAIKHGKTGYLAASNDDWYFYLKQLAEDPELRARLGHNAYYATLAKFGPLSRGRDLAGMLDQLRGGVAAIRAFALDKHIATKPWYPPKVFPSKLIFASGGQQSAEVTVVVPLYNYRDFVVETLESVKAQTLACLDLVVIDGCSTDDSLVVAKRWVEQNAKRFNRAIVLQNEQNYGLGFCRNSGFDAADTPYVLPLDADNKLRPECCQDLLDLIRSTGAAFTYSTLQKFGANNGLVCNHPFEPQRFVGANYIDAMALTAKEAWAMVGGIDHVRYGWEDYDFWCRLAESGMHGEWIPRPLADYRVHATSMMRAQTHASNNYRFLMEEFSRRHPWVSLIDQGRWHRLPEPDNENVRAATSSRLEKILPLLRCPDTGQKLVIDWKSSKLVSLDGSRNWPIIEGRAVFSSGSEAPVVKPGDHISNELPEGAIKLIESSRGPVLNLSAGGTATKYDHVIEAEYAIFRHTDIVADAHCLPFDDESFEAVIVMNAFEHYRDPKQAAAELFRVLKPGGKVLVRTAFLQPQHEAPWHFYNCTRYGLSEWFKHFETEQLHVSDNFSPNYSIAWLASECEAALREGVSLEAADNFASASVGDLVSLWRDPASRSIPLWNAFYGLSQQKQEGIAAGFEFLGRRPLNLPRL